MANNTDVVESSDGQNLIILNSLNLRHFDSTKANSRIILAVLVTFSHILAPPHYLSKNLSDDVWVKSNYTHYNILLSISNILMS